MADEKEVIFNGIDPDTGAYLFPPMTYAEVAKRIKRPVSKAEAKASQQKAAARRPKVGGRFGENLDDIRDGGWAVVLHKDEDPQVRKALERLRAHRSTQVKDQKRLKVLTYSGEPSAEDWLKALQVNPGDIEPWKVPSFLLIVGSPERIPFKFSRGLPKEYAVGLLHFDHAEEYKRYVDSLINYESGEATLRSKEAVFFRTRHDMATELSALNLVMPLADGVPEQPDGAPAEPPVGEQEGFYTRRIWDTQATKDALTSVFAHSPQSIPPAFFFSASHGAGPGERTPEQIAGALRCQDKTLFSAQSLTEMNDDRVYPLFVFLNACYSAGMPNFDEFPLRLDRPSATIAEKSFLAALPKALLSHAEDGVLACIGHVEKAFSYSFHTRGRDHLIPYRNAILRILQGLPVGLALKDMRDRYNARNDELVQLLYNIQAFKLNVNDRDLVAKWSERNEAGGYVLIGDPATRLDVKKLVPVVS